MIVIVNVCLSLCRLCKEVVPCPGCTPSTAEIIGMENRWTDLHLYSYVYVDVDVDMLEMRYIFTSIGNLE